MINNNKGAILLVTIVSMMILTIIGYITLQMTSSQGVADTYEQAKIRVEYAAEGMVERARGYIEYIVAVANVPQTPATMEFGDIGFGANSGAGTLFSRVSSAGGKWFLFENGVDPNYGNAGTVDSIDNSMYPAINTRVWCEFVNTNINEGIGDHGNEVHPHTFVAGGVDNMQTYRIVCEATTVVNAADVGTITSTVRYYFNTEHNVNNGNHTTTYHFLGWRKS